MPDLLAPKVQRDPAHQHHRRDGRHGAVRVEVARLSHPRVGVEGQQEAKQRLESHDGERDLARHGPVRVDDVDETDVGALDDGEVDCVC